MNKKIEKKNVYIKISEKTERRKADQKGRRQDRTLVGLSDWPCKDTLELRRKCKLDDYDDYFVEDANFS